MIQRRTASNVDRTVREIPSVNDIGGGQRVVFIPLFVALEVDTYKWLFTSSSTTIALLAEAQSESMRSPANFEY